VITSRTNKRIKEIRLLQHAKHRQSRGEYFIEGVRLVEEALAEAGFVRQVLHSPRLQATLRGEKLLSSLRRKFQGAEWLAVDDRVLTSLSDTENHQGILVVLKKREWTWSALEQRKGLVLCFHELQDPGNLGAIFRVLDAGGGSGMILGSSSVDPYSPKVVRASMGSFFRVPFLILRQSPEAILQELRSHGYRLWAATARGQKSFWEIDSFGSAAVLFGQEGGGLPEEWAAQADGTLSIPMTPPTDSLNVAMAAGLIVYEGFRQGQDVKGKGPETRGEGRLKIPGVSGAGTEKT
jgi:RNA methyltransferase, TrmH family